MKTYRYIYPLCRYFRSVFNEQLYPAYDKGGVTGDWKRDCETIRKRCMAILADLDLEAYAKPVPRPGEPRNKIAKNERLSFGVFPKSVYICNSIRGCGVIGSRARLRI